MKKPDPKPFRFLLLREVDEHRCLDCIHYSKCLDFAAANMWESFTCTECEAFEEAPPDERPLRTTSEILF